MNSNFIIKLNKNLKPEIGNVIDESFATFKKSIWTMGIALILLAILAVILTGSVMVFAFGISSLEEFVSNSATLNTDLTYLVINGIVGVVMAGLFTPITAGFYKINHLAKNDKEFSLSTIFEYYSSPFLKELIIYGILVGLITNITSLGLTYLEMPFIGGALQLIIAFLFIFGVPLIIFENQNATEAMSYSSKLALRNPFTIIVCVILAFIIALLGMIAICIGVIFTYGYIYTMNYSLYNNIIPIDNENPIDEIGLE